MVPQTSQNGTPDPWLTVPCTTPTFAMQVQQALQESMRAVGTPPQPDWHARLMAFWGADNLHTRDRTEWDPRSVRRLKNARDAAEVAVLLDRPGTPDAVELCTALHTLSHLYGRKMPSMPREDIPGLQTLVYETLYRLLVAMRTQHVKKRQQTVSNALYSLARLYLPIEDGCAFQMLCDIGMSVVPVANFQATANMRFALTLLGATEGAGKELSDALAKRSLGMVRTLAAQRRLSCPQQPCCPALLRHG